MKTYTFSTKHVTLHDVAVELGHPKQTIRYWLARHQIPVIQIAQGDRVGCTMIPAHYLPLLRKLSQHARERKQLA